MSRIEKLLRRELQQLRFSGATLTLLETNTLEADVAEALLKTIFQGRVTVKRVKTGARYRPTSLENELCRQLRAFLEDEEREEKEEPLLASVPEAAIVAYAEEHGFTGPLLAPRDDVRALLETLQERQPQTKSALRKSFAHIEKQKKRAPKPS